MNITFYDKKEKPWTFLHIPKTAGKSISAYIMQFSLNSKTLHNSSHATLKEIKELNLELGTTFAVFRNPYSRAVSLYRFLFELDIRKVTETSKEYFNAEPDFSWHDDFIKTYGKLDFLSFCKELPWMPLGVEQYHYMPVDKYLYIENLTEDFKIIQSALGVEAPLYKLNQTNNFNWQRYYTKSTQRIIAETYSKDFKLLKYSKDINNSSI